MEKKETSRKKAKRREEEFFYPEPKKLSKFGEWRRAHPNDFLEILDMRAVMK